MPDAVERIEIVTLARLVDGRLRTVGALARRGGLIAAAVNEHGGPRDRAFLAHQVYTGAGEKAAARMREIAGQGNGVTLSWSALVEVDDDGRLPLRQVAEDAADRAADLEAEFDASA